MTAPIAEQTCQQHDARRTWPIFAVCGLVVGALRVESLADPNVLWETRNGLSIISSGDLPHSDSWSWTVNGQHWIPNSWAWDVALGGVYRAAGSGGLVVLNLVLVAALFLGISSVALRSGATSRVTVVVVGVVGGAMMMPWVIIRPQLASYLFVLAVVPLTRRILSCSRRELGKWLGFLAVGQVIWVNVHLFGVIGPVLVLLAGFGLVVARARRTEDAPFSTREGVARLAAATAIACAMCAITPYGAVAVSKSFAVRDDAVGLIVEWRPAGFSTFSQLTAVIAIVVALFAATHAVRAMRWEVVALLVVLAIGAATACRFAPALAVVALPEFAAWATTLATRRWFRRTGVTIAILVVALALGVGLVQINEFGTLRRASNSSALIDDLPRGCRVLNDYQLGGALIMFRPDVRVSVDSRTDLYGRAGLERNEELLDTASGSLTKVLDRAGVRCVLAPTDSMAVRTLRDDHDQWGVVGTQGSRTLLIRRYRGL